MIRDKRQTRLRRLNRLKRKKRLKYSLALFGVLAICLGIAGRLAYIKFGVQIPELTAQSEVAPPPASVTAADVQVSRWQSQIKAVGSLVASQGIDITSEVDGIVNSLEFVSGEDVERGQLLFMLNNQIEQAALTAAEARYASAYNQYQRSLKLKSKKFVTENELDQQRWAADSARSQVKSARASLNKKNIHAPFAGKLGIRDVDVGDYVSPGMKLVTLQAVDTLYLDFTLPERNFTQLAVGQAIEFEVRSYPGETFKGHVQAWDPNLDVNTRNVNVRAVVENENRLLAPGMFAEIIVQSTDSSTVMTVPETAIFYNIYGEAVYVLEPEQNNSATVDLTGQTEPEASDAYVVAARQVKVLYRKNGLAGVVSGLNEKDKVVTSGQLKLFPSMKVVITGDMPDPAGITTIDKNRSQNVEG